MLYLKLYFKLKKLTNQQTSFGEILRLNVPYRLFGVKSKLERNSLKKILLQYQKIKKKSSLCEF